MIEKISGQKAGRFNRRTPYFSVGFGVEYYDSSRPHFRSEDVKKIKKRGAVI